MSITRVMYRERQRLTAADLHAEQEYRLGIAGRHHLAPHDWGVIRGLRVLAAGGGQFLLTPGIAIDGYGRELFVPTPTQFTIEGYDENKCWFVQIHYCEDPEQVPPGRECEDVPAPRIRQRTQIRVTQTFFPPDSATELATARAAGVIADALPWPVLVARIGKGCPGTTRTSPLIDYSQVPYARHLAASIRSPTGNAKLQLGLTGLTDIYHFLLSTRGATNELEKRFGIDRDGTVHVWRSLMVSGDEGYGVAEVGQGLKLQITMPMPAGLGQTLQIQGQVDAELKELSASLVQLGPTPLGGAFAISGQTTLALQSVTLPFANVHTASVSLLDVLDRARAPQPIRFADGRKRVRRALDRLHAHALAVGTPEPAAPAVAFSMQLSATGGLLAADAVLLRPAAKLDAEPLFREIHAVVTSKDADPVPKTELHISGGEADDSDASGRVSVGARTTKGYLAALRMDGSGRLRVLSGPDVDTPEPLLEVTGTTYLPPIGKNDPMLPDLLTLAFVAGQFQIGNVATHPKLELSKNTTDDGIYDLKITNQQATAYTIKRTLELIFGDESAGPADMSVRALDEITAPNGANQSTTKKIPVPGLAPPHRKIRIAVLMLVESGNKTRVLASKALALEIPA